jgi:hypothetical protein
MIAFGWKLEYNIMEMGKAQRGKSIDMMYLGKELSYSSEVNLEGIERRLALTSALGYYNYKYKTKDNSKVVIKYAQDNDYSSDDISLLKSASNTVFFNNYTTLIRISKRGWTLNEDEVARITSGIEYALNFARERKVIDDDKEADPYAVVVAKVTPQDRLNTIISDTILTDLDAFENEWIERVNGNTYDIFKKATGYGLTGPKIKSSVIAWVQPRIDEMEMAVSKREDDEEYAYAYSHIKPSAIKNRIKVLKNILLDLESLTLVAKATRKVRKPKVKSADKQIAKMKYKTKDNDFKLASINPIDIIGSYQLLVFNTKYGVVTEYTTTRVGGFEVKGTTLLHYEADKSRSTRLRKPDEFLKICLKKTAKQLDKEWKKLTTKDSVPNGRINEHTILLKAN